MDHACRLTPDTATPTRSSDSRDRRESTGHYLALQLNTIVSTYGVRVQEIITGFRVYKSKHWASLSNSSFNGIRLWY
jgi:hypothetical protein